MAKYPITPENANAWLAEVRTDEALKQETINGLRTDVIAYAESKFEFTESQRNFLRNMPAGFRAELGHLIAMAIEYDYPLTFSYESSSSGDKGVGGYSKVTWTEQAGWGVEQGVQWTL